jgi:hypothetical protein
LTAPCAPLVPLTLAAARALRAHLGADPVEAALLARVGGLRVAEAARSVALAGDPRGRRVVVVTRAIGQADAATQAGLWLRAWGAEVVAVGAGVFGGLTCRANPAAGDEDVDVVIDGLWGLEGAREGDDETVAWLATVSSPVVSIDCPAGLDLDTNLLADPSVRAVATVALGSAVELILHFDVSDAVGDVWVADLGWGPEQLQAWVDDEVGPAFAMSGLVDGR